tara:strand:+ start:556 stop:786 length:231 start_codon:yes stop_codon:yes gene_type:complete
MSLKNKALLYNFLSFAVIFIVLRFFIVGYFVEAHFLKSLLSAIFTMILAPKFAILKNKEGIRIMMKWLFLKGFKEL